MKYVCNVCGWVYDEEEAGVKWEETNPCGKAWTRKGRAKRGGGELPFFVQS